MLQRKGGGPSSLMRQAAELARSPRCVGSQAIAPRRVCAQYMHGFTLILMRLSQSSQASRRRQVIRKGCPDSEARAFGVCPSPSVRSTHALTQCMRLNGLNAREGVKSAHARRCKNPKMPCLQVKGTLKMRKATTSLALQLAKPGTDTGPQKKLKVTIKGGWSSKGLCRVSCHQIERGSTSTLLCRRASCTSACVGGRGLHTFSVCACVGVNTCLCVCVGMGS